MYQLPIPSDKPEIVQHGLQIMRDWAQEVTLDPVEINKERGVVLEEKRLGKDAAERMRRQYFTALLNNSIYAKRIPIGTDEVLNNFKPETIKQFYHDWYRPDLQALIVVGDIDVDTMEKDIKAKFGDLKNPGNEKPRTKYTMPLTGKNQFIAVTDPEMTQTEVQVIMKQPELGLHTTADYRTGIIRELFNMMLADRFTDLQRQANLPFLGGSAGAGDFIGGLDNFSVSVTAKPGELENGIKAAWRVNDQAMRFGFTATELERAKIAYQNQYELAVKEKDKTPSESYVKEYLQYFLKGDAAPGIVYEYNLVKTDLPGITFNEVNTYAKTNLNTTDRDISIMAPEKDKAALPTNDVFNDWIKAVVDEEITTYHDETSKESLLKTQPVAGKIVKEQRDAKLNITTLTLSNGTRVLLKPTAFKNDEILFSGSSAGGTSLYSDADFQSASAANIVPSFGAGNYNNTVIAIPMLIKFNKYQL